MKILIDMCLSPEWRVTLAAAGFEAVHWSEIGEGNAPDHALFDWAAARDFVIFTHDLDFGTLLALSKSRKPSVIHASIPGNNAPRDGSGCHFRPL